MITTARRPPSVPAIAKEGGSLTVDEILTTVNVALGSSDVSQCRAGDRNGDGQITIDEILTAVNNALAECQR